MIPRPKIKHRAFNNSYVISTIILLVCFFVNSFVFISRVEAAVIEHSGTINSQTTWSNSDIHLITCDVTVSVSVGVTLTVEAGTIIKFNSGTRLDVNGALYAVGNTSEKIVFTSYRDDSSGGDTNGGGFSTGQPGDWGHISFSNTVIDSLTRLEHVKILYGGGPPVRAYTYLSQI